jgi:hypothetical protein
MAANTAPIWSLSPSISGCNFTVANTNSDGTGTIGTNIFKAFTADATNGSYVSRIRLACVGTTAGTNTTATVLRVYICSVSSGATTPGTNCWLFTEIAQAIQTTDSASAATYQPEIPLNFALPAGYTILVSTHVVSVANTFYQATVYGGNY